jgi:UDP-N-acetylmuramoyl-L-alanyl-D-glutamate--2,6-diaminopimelate ligase
MHFSELLRGTGASWSGGDPRISGLDYDSRRVQPGWLFVAMHGESTNGNRYIDAALTNGAAAVVTDAKHEHRRPGVPWAVVHNGRQALAHLSANFYGQPAHHLKIVGITGTNGKTTTSFLSEWILGHCGIKSALIGTIEYHVAGAVLPAPHTTPEALELNQILAAAWETGATHAVMEVSSHALAQGRVWGVPYEVAVFTNLTRDHLDYHREMSSYFDAKRLLFTGCGSPPPPFAIVNVDDEYGRKLVETTKTIPRQQLITYGIQDGDFRAGDVDLTPEGSSFTLATTQGSVRIRTALLGGINVYNTLAAAAASSSLGCTLDQIGDAMAQFKQVPGRFEKVDCGQPFSVIVDYAHTDDALRNLTTVARDFVHRGLAMGRVITVFGCGGDRDRSKRPLMGEAAGRGSNFVVLTSDNPRSEDPAQVIADSLPGLQKTGTRHVVEPDRQHAIRLALIEAMPGDIVLIAGKGHEKVQVTREGVFPFDDVQVARKELEHLGYIATADLNCGGPK